MNALNEEHTYGERRGWSWGGGQHHMPDGERLLLLYHVSLFSSLLISAVSSVIVL